MDTQQVQRSQCIFRFIAGLYLAVDQTYSNLPDMSSLVGLEQKLSVDPRVRAGEQMSGSTVATTGCGVIIRDHQYSTK